MPPENQASSAAELLHRVGQVLGDSCIPWATIGALAVAYHGWVRASLDADALITLRDSGIDTAILTERLRNRGWKVELREGDAEDPLGFVFRIQDEAGNQVDLIGGIRGLDPAFFQRALETEFNGLHLHVASPEDLIALKVFAGGPKDLEDAAGILDVMGSSINQALLIKLCRKFGPEEAKRCSGLLER